jgi:CheY-like chemotaxis protein
MGLKQYLRRHGFRVTTAPDADAARRLLETLDFDLLVLDVMMPREDSVSAVSTVTGEAVAAAGFFVIDPVTTITGPASSFLASVVLASVVAAVLVAVCAKAVPAISAVPRTSVATPVLSAWLAAIFIVTS